MNTRRVQLEMPPQSMERLERLKDKTEAASYAEVVRNALRMYEALIGETDKGKRVVLRATDGTETCLFMAQHIEDVRAKYAEQGIETDETGLRTGRRIAP